MGVPRKGSRRLNLDGVVYLWHVRGDGYSRRRGPSPIRLTLTCQRDVERPGRVLQVVLAGKAASPSPPDEGRTHVATLGPRVVRSILACALKAGWDPMEAGAPFSLRGAPELDHYVVV
jgi:hypothetical protein